MSMSSRARCGRSFALLLAASSVSALAEEAPPDTSVIFQSFRTYASEDTLALPRFIYGKYVDVEANRVSLDEILERCIAAEERKFEGVDDITCTLTSRSVQFFGDPERAKTKRLVTEEITRIYRKRPDLVQVVDLGKREYSIENGARKDEPSDEEVAIRIHSARRELTSLPFFFEDRSDHRFSIEERVDLPDRVLYRVRFDPRSDFDPLPSGFFWIDTEDFRIFHTELWFEKSVPAPLILDGVDHVAIEMEKVEGNWVERRVAGRIRLNRIPLIKVPRVVDIVLTFDDYAFNQGLSDDVFGGGS